MSAEYNKILCAILSAILIFLLSSFIGDLLYHPQSKSKKLAYKIEQEEKIEINDDNRIKKEKILTLKEIEELLIKANLESGEKFALKNCSACHSFVLPVKNKIGPSLATLLNRKIGSVKEFKYSKSFLEIDDIWSIDNLYYFLQKPKEWAPGTKMSYRGISKKEDLVNILKYLSHISTLNAS